jgi:hypothetical protein
MVLCASLFRQLVALFNKSQSHHLVKDHEVKTNILGKTGLRVSVLGLGGHECRWLHAGNIKDSRHVRFNPERLGVVKRALDAGGNLFDTTFQEEVESLGHILGKVGWPGVLGIRDCFFTSIHLSMRSGNKQNLSSSKKRSFLPPQLRC